MKPGNGEHFRTEASLENLHEFREFINQCGQRLGVRKQALSDLCLAVDEAVTNVILHGYQGKGGPIEIRMAIQGKDLLVTIRDRAPAFNADEVQQPRLNTGLTERPVGGMGVFLIDRMTDHHDYRAHPDGNELSLVKKEVLEQG